MALRISTLAALAVGAVGVTVYIVASRVASPEETAKPVAVTEPSRSPGASIARRDAAVADAQPDAPVEPLCGEKPCLPVPTGIKGLSFGLTLAEARSAAGEKLARGEPFQVRPAKARPYERTKMTPVDGFTAAFETTLGSEKASCSIHFGADGHLAGVRCSIAVANTDNNHALGRAIFDTLEASLVRQYGEPHERKRLSLVHRQNESIWSSDEARLTLIRGYRSVRIENDSAEHIAVIEATKQRAQREIDEREAEARRRLKEGERKLDRDLGGPAERPRP